MSLPFNESIIIIPTYNEIENIEKMIHSIFLMYPGINLLIIDDTSPDGTADTVRKLMKKFNCLHFIQRVEKLGIGTAYVAGFKYALEREYNFIFTMDCDFSHDPKDIKRLLKGALKYDLVIGSRYVKGGKVIDWPLGRLILSKSASIYSRIVTRIPIEDTTGGFKCFTRKALEAVNISGVISKGYIFQLEMNFIIWKSGMEILEIPISFRERKNGKSKMEGRIIVEALVKVFIIRFKK